MKKIVFLSSVLLLSIMLHGQVNSDSLWSIWNDPGRADTSRLDALNEFLYAFRIQPDSSLSVANMMLDLANAKGLKRHQVDALIQQSRSLTYLSDFENGIDAAEAGLQLAEEIEYQYGAARSLGMLGVIQYLSGKLILAINYYDRALEIAEKASANSKSEIAWGDIKSFSLANFTPRLYNIIGEVYRSMGAYVKALSYYEKALEKNEAEGDQKQIAENLNNIALIYINQGEATKAEEYFNQAFNIAEAIGVKSIMAVAYGNIGNIYLNAEDYQKAEEYIAFTLELSEERGDIQRIGGVNMQLAQINMERGDYPESLRHINEASRIANDLGNRNMICHVLLYRGSLYLKQNNFNQAKNWFKKGLTLSQEINQVSLQRDACEGLYQSLKSLNQWKNSLEYHEQFLLLNDSLQLGETGKKLQLMEFSKQMLADSLVQEEEKLKVEMAHQDEVRRKDNTRNALLGSGFLVVLMAGGLWSRLNFTRKSKAVLQIEKDRSESLLLNILPAEVAEELKVNGEAVAKDFDMVSIIFTDFKGFTAMSANLNAGELVSELNYCFKGFDMIMEKYGIEKIKTIGDAYMAAGGMAEDSNDSARNTVRAALEMQKFITNRKKEQDALGLMAFEMRVGIHSGPVVAGIVGVKKFQYDIWGDTVNTASRMESNGEVGKVNISKETFELIQNDSSFAFENRGKIKAKGKGEMEMYFIDSISS